MFAETFFITYSIYKYQSKDRSLTDKEILTKYHAYNESNPDKVTNAYRDRLFSPPACPLHRPSNDILVQRYLILELDYTEPKTRLHR